MKLPEFSVNRKVTASMLAMILVVVGLITFSRLGLDFFPDIEFPTVSIITVYRGASSEDIENTLTRPLEQVVSSVNRVKKVTSTSFESISLLMVEFEWGASLDFAAQDVRDQIGLYRSYLPSEASDPLVVKFNLGQMPIIFYGITGDMPTFALKEMIEDEVAPRLERIDGVAAAQVFATDIREIIVDVDKAALEARRLSLDQVILALRMENLNLPAGHLVERHSDFLVRTVGEFRSLEDIRRTVVGATAIGDPVFLGDIAEIRDAMKETRYRTRIQRRDGVYLIINKRSGANTAITGEAVKKELAGIMKTLPPDVEFYEAMDQSDMIKRFTSKTANNALLGGILAIFLIFLFLRNWRPTLTIAVAIPLSIITTFIAFYLAGYTLNLLTLGGLALGVGMLVDNAVVVIENIFRHREEGKDRDRAAIAGASEVGMAITASTLTTIAVFFPMVFASGITGRLTRGLALAIAFSLISSLFVALTIVPMLASLLFKNKKGSNDAVKKEKRIPFDRFRRFYRGILSVALRRRGRVLGGALVLFLLSFVVISFLGTEFMPSMDRNMIFLYVRMPVGTSLEETNRVVTMVEDILAREPEVKIISASVGSRGEDDPADMAGGFSATGTHEGVLWIGLVNRNERDLSGVEVLEKVRRKLPRLENVRFESMDLGQMMMGGSQTPVEIKIFGKDIGLLKDIADNLVERIKDVDGLRDLTHSLAIGKPEYHIKIDREKAYRMGLMVNQVANTVQAATLGQVATRFRDGSEEVDIRVRFQEKYRDRMDEIKKIPLLTQLNRVVYLDQVADIDPGEGPIQITRENQTRRVMVTANIASRDLGSVVRDIKTNIGTMDKSLPPGYFMEFGGAYEQMQEAFLVLAAAFALAVLLVYMVMASQFESFLHPFVIMFSIPLSLIGVTVGLLVAGRPVNLPVMIGFIILAGIAVNNGIVMIDYINQLIRKGMDKKEAILQGCTVRLRPVLITALTTICGMLPMALTTSEGAEMRAPMAITVIGGMVATTLLTLLVIPIVYSLVNRISFKGSSG